MEWKPSQHRLISLSDRVGMDKRISRGLATSYINCLCLIMHLHINGATARDFLIIFSLRGRYVRTAWSVTPPIRKCCRMKPMSLTAHQSFMELLANAVIRVLQNMQFIKPPIPRKKYQGLLLTLPI